MNIDPPLLSSCAGFRWRCCWRFPSPQRPRRRKPSPRRKRRSMRSWPRSRPTAMRRWSRSSAKSTRNWSSRPIARQTSANRAKILAAMQTLRVLREPGQDRRVLLIGDQAWPMPIPIVRTGDRWRFATEEGEEELINRRIGGNERNAIYVLRRLSRRAARSTRRAIATATACCSTRRSSPARRASRTACIGPPTPRRAKREPVRAADRRERGVPEGPQGGRPLPRLSLPDPDAPGQERARAAPTTTSSTAA